MARLSEKEISKSKKQPNNGHASLQVEQTPECTRAGYYQGPVPPPNIMEAYGRIDASFPERIMKEFEKNSEHIRDMEKSSLNEAVSRDKRGQCFGFILALGLLAVVLFSLFLGNITFAGVATLGFFGLMIPAFLPRKVEQKEPDQNE